VAIKNYDPDSKSTRRPRGFVVYYRTSAAEGPASELDVRKQKQAIVRYLKARSGQIRHEFTELAIKQHGHRPELIKALETAQICRASILVAKLGRLARSSAFLKRLLQADVNVCFADFPAIAERNSRRALRDMVAVADHEAKLISARTKSALAAAKARGAKLGGNRGAKLLARAAAAGCAVIAARANERAADISPAISEIRAAGITSLRGIAVALNERGIPTARGCTWTGVQVSRILARLKATHRIHA
jgi:DNA invertase Pin-like site-specific DNA recombinase